MIEIKNISKTFGKLRALDHVDLNCADGQTIALIGPNGCGKTTLIKSILGMVIPDSGQILFDGSPIEGNDAYRRKIGYMPQIGRYPDNMSIGQLIDMIRMVRADEKALDEDLLHQFGLPKMYHKRMNTLSGGTTQKVSATLAFLFDPRVLILDEPTAGLDPVAAEHLKEKILQEQRKGKLVLITSHMLSELDDLVTQVVFMQDGSVRFHQDIAELKSSTGEEKISRAISSILKQEQYV